MVAVLVALFVLAPIAEAAACGGEVTESAVSTNYDITVTGSQPSDELPSDPKDVCMHGHCHHSSQQLAQSRDSGQLNVTFGGLHFDRADEGGPDALLDNLYPPPRA